MPLRLSGNAVLRAVVRVLVVVLVGLLTALVGGPGAAAADDGRAGPAAVADTSDAARALLDRHRPVVMVKAQDALCDDEGEPFVPLSPSAVLDNPQIALRQVGAGNPVVTWGPGGADLAERGAGFYLDFPGEALRPDCVYARDSERFGAGRPPVVLGRLLSQPDRPGFLVAQYWLYWYYNDWNNKHESDWEGIQVVFEASSVEEALAEGPVATGFAQHEGGERSDWDDDKLGKEGARPVVYVSRRSHASYYGSSLFLGRAAAEGFGCDTTDDPSNRLDPVLEVMPDPAADRDPSTGWVTYEGLWGERGQGPNNGPQGPITKLRWDRPLDWQDTLRDESFIVPAGDSGGASLATSFCRLVGFGSNQLNSFQESPLRLLAVLAVVVVVVRFLVGRTTWAATEPLPLARRRSVGQILRGAVAVYRRRPLRIAATGLIAIPVGTAAAIAGAVLTNVPLLGALVLRGEEGSSDLFFATVLAALSALVSTGLATGLVLRSLQEPGEATSGPAGRGRAAAGRVGPLLATTLPAVALVSLLGVTVIGLPVAVWLTVRLAHVGPVVMLEGRSGWDAYRRSGQLNRHRWFRTATTVLVVTVVLNTTGAVVGLLALVAFQGLPLWVLSVSQSALQLLLVPLAALTMGLLYGDAVAVEDAVPAAPRRPVPAGV
jgi:hypothetical protein